MTIRSKEYSLPSVLETAPVNVQKEVEEMTTSEQREVIDLLEHFIANAMWKLGYIDGRFGNGSGDQGHESAVKSANKYRGGVRKVMGFNKTRDINV